MSWHSIFSQYWLGRSAFDKIVAIRLCEWPNVLTSSTWGRILHDVASFYHWNEGTRVLQAGHLLTTGVGHPSCSNWARSTNVVMCPTQLWLKAVLQLESNSSHSRTWSSCLVWARNNCGFLPLAPLFFQLAYELCMLLLCNLPGQRPSLPPWISFPKICFPTTHILPIFMQGVRLDDIIRNVAAVGMNTLWSHLTQFFDFSWALSAMNQVLNVSLGGR